jgi:hypothetical protein
MISRSINHEPSKSRGIKKSVQIWELYFNKSIYLAVLHIKDGEKVIWRPYGI